MIELVTYLSENSIVALFLIIGLGLGLGSISINGFSFGSIAVFFIGVVFGHMGIQLPEDIKTLGLVLFVYSIGLQVGPRFFNTFKKYGMKLVLISITSLLTTGIIILLLSYILKLPKELAIGCFSGSLASTPGLASVSQINHDPRITSGFAICYPFSIICVVIFVQIISKIQSIKIEVKNEIRQLGKDKSKIQVKYFEVTNPNFSGIALIDLDLHNLSAANITHIKRNEDTFLAYDDSMIYLGDIIRAVGSITELRKMKYFVGKEIQIDFEFTQDFVSQDVYVSTDKISGKALKELEVRSLYGVVITQIRRDEIEFAPTGRTTLEIGDLIRIAGNIDRCKNFTKLIGQQERRLNETNLLPLILGLIIGLVIGSLEFVLPGGFSFQLGIAGGPLLVALLFSHYGKIFNISIRTPYAVKYFTREIGLVFFLAVVGANAGEFFVQTFLEYGLKMFVLGISTTTIPIMLTYFLVHKLFKFGNLESIGLICGVMTNTPAISIFANKVQSDTPIIVFTSIYAISTVLIIIMNQFFAVLLS
jgi:putative transport protein